MFMIMSLFKNYLLSSGSSKEKIYPGPHQNQGCGWHVKLV